MHITVLGSTGSLGSHVCVELLKRGHEVAGIARSPGKLGQHKRYQPVPLDISAAKVEDFLKIFKGTEAIFWGYHPHPTPNVYKNFLETARIVIMAVKAISKDSPAPYFVMVGGTGSLELPGRPLETVLDDPKWWLALQRYLADSQAATAEMIERLELSGTAIAESRWAYRNARLAMKDGRATNEQSQIIQENEKHILNGGNSIPDIPLAARAAFMMFEGNTSFNWTFLSPPVGYRRAAAVGKYQIKFDELPMRPLAQEQFDAQETTGVEDRLLGISVPDLALAIVDELETQEKARKHWTAVGDLKEDVAFERSARIT